MLTDIYIRTYTKSIQTKGIQLINKNETDRICQIEIKYIHQSKNSRKCTTDPFLLIYWNYITLHFVSSVHTGEYAFEAVGGLVLGWL